MLGEKFGIGGAIGLKSVHNFMMGTKKKSVQENAELANLAYTNPEERPDMMGGFKKVEPLSDDRIAVYKDDTSKKINVGFRGTANATDIGTDITAVIGGSRGTNPYFQRAEGVIEQLKKDNPDYSITVAGHSLGGTVAKYVAERNPDIRAFGYNTGSFLQDAFKQNPENFYSFRNKTDIISLLDNPSNPRGQFYNLKNPLSAHGIGTFLNR